MKKGLLILIALVMPLLLTACGSGDEEKNSDAASNLKLFETEEASMKYPSNFEILTPKDFTVEVPVGTVVAFRNTVRNDEFTANISVVKVHLPEEKTSLDYAKGLLAKHARELVNFKEIKRTDTKIKTGIGEFDSLFMYFSGKEKPDGDNLEFLQTSVVKVKTAYIVTGAFLPGEDEGVKKIIEESINTFEVK